MKIDDLVLSKLNSTTNSIKIVEQKKNRNVDEEDEEDEDEEDEIDQEFDHNNNENNYVGDEDKNKDDTEQKNCEDKRKEKEIDEDKNEVIHSDFANNYDLADQNNQILNQQEKSNKTKSTGTNKPSSQTLKETDGEKRSPGRPKILKSVQTTQEDKEKFISSLFSIPNNFDPDLIIVEYVDKEDNFIMPFDMLTNKSK